MLLRLRRVLFRAVIGLGRFLFGLRLGGLLPLGSRGAFGCILGRGLLCGRGPLFESLLLYILEELVDIIVIVRGAVLRGGSFCRSRACPEAACAFLFVG